LNIAEINDDGCYLMVKSFSNVEFLRIQLCKVFFFFGYKAKKGENKKRNNKKGKTEANALRKASLIHPTAAKEAGPLEGRSEFPNQHHSMLLAWP